VDTWCSAILLKNEHCVSKGTDLYGNVMRAILLKNDHCVSTGTDLVETWCTAILLKNEHDLGELRKKKADCTQNRLSYSLLLSKHGSCGNLVQRHLVEE
jgi:hypothetical protein